MNEAMLTPTGDRDEPTYAMDSAMVAEFEQLSEQAAKAGRLQESLKGLLMLAGAMLGLMDGYRHRLGLGELEPLRQRWEADLKDSFQQAYTYAVWGADFTLAHTLFDNDSLSQQAIADRVTQMLGGIADGVEELYRNDPPCPSPF